MRQLIRTIIFTALMSTRPAEAQVGTARSPASSMTAPMAALLPPDLQSVGGAPIGHRQPKMKDVPSENPRDLDKVGEEDRTVDRKLVICRGC